MSHRPLTRSLFLPYRCGFDCPVRAVHTSRFLLILAAGCGEGSDAIYARGLDAYARRDYAVARAPITEATQEKWV